MITESKVIELKKQITAPDASISTIMSALNELQKVTATTSLMSDTQIGLVVGRLRKNEDAKVSQCAKNLVKKWKEDVENEGNANHQDLSKKRSRNDADNDLPVIKKEIKLNKVDTSSVQVIGKETGPVSPAWSPDTVEEMGGIRLVAGKVRNVKIDNAKIAKTGDVLRDKSVEIIYQGMATNTDAEKSIVIERSLAIEQCVYEQNLYSSESSSYREKIRTLFLNLKDPKNPSLRLRILSGQLDSTRFCEMTADEMKSKEQQEKDELIRQENLFKAQGAKPQEAETDQFKCGKCHQRRCRYYQMQTRSADEPMTTFVTCANCNNRWKFC